MLFPQMTHATVIGENFLHSPKTAHEPFEKIKNPKKEKNQILTSFLIIFSVT
jgi:hypothetical protein